MSVIDELMTWSANEMMSLIDVISPQTGQNWLELLGIVRKLLELSDFKA